MKPALVVIDMQQYFFRTSQRSEKLDELICNINDLIDFANAKEMPIYQVQTIHKEDKSTWNNVMKKHNYALLLEGSEEAQLIEGINVDESQEAIIKTRQSAFIRTDFEDRLKDKEIDTLIVCGVFTHGCVGRTAIDAYERDFNVILAKDASFSHLSRAENVMHEVIAIEQEQLILHNEEIKKII